MQLGRVGLWTFQFDFAPLEACRRAGREIESLGYPCLWVPEVGGREAVSLATLLLEGTERLVVATGIARANERSARAMAAAQLTLVEAHPGRFLLGVGGQTRLAGADPVTALRDYLEQMDAASYAPPRPPAPPPRVLAAINPRMLRLARDVSAGAHTYLVPPEQVARAREELGAGPLLASEQPVVLAPDADTARRVARRHTAHYLRLPPYRRVLSRLGFSEREMAGGGSDRLVDLLVTWGGTEAVAARVEQCLAAGADHVSLQVLPRQEATIPLADWRALAPMAAAVNEQPSRPVAPGA